VRIYAFLHFFSPEKWKKHWRAICKSDFYKVHLHLQQQQTLKGLKNGLQDF